MVETDRRAILAKVNQIDDLAKALLAELANGKRYGLEEEFSVATTHVQTARLWAVVGLRGAVAVAAEETASGEA